MLSTISSNCYRSCVLISFTNLHPFSPFTLSFIFSLLGNFSPVSLLLSPAPLLWSGVLSISPPSGLIGFFSYGLFSTLLNLFFLLSTVISHSFSLTHPLRLSQVWSRSFIKENSRQLYYAYNVS